MESRNNSIYKYSHFDNDLSTGYFLLYCESLHVAMEMTLVTLTVTE